MSEDLLIEGFWEMKMKISIITITYNAELAIKSTIQSVIDQTRPIYEYIFIDGASTDQTNEIIKGYYHEFEKQNIRYIHISEPDRGISDAFNKGIKKTTGNLIGILNAGDQMLPNTSEYLYRYGNNKPFDILYGNCIWVDEINNLRYVKKPKGDLGRLYYDLVLIHPSTFVKKESYDKYGLFNVDYKFCMDKELLCRMYDAGARFMYADKEFTLFKAGGISDQNAVKTIAEGIQLSHNYHKPKIITYSNAARKILQYYISRILKKTPVYFFLKGAKKIH